MLQSILVPDAVFIENEDLARIGVAEYKFLVEGVGYEHQVVLDVLLGIDLLQIPDVDDLTVSATEQECLVENDLLGVRQ